MRIVTKNEMIVLMGSDFNNFVDFCFTPEGSKLKWMFEQASSFDLDESLVQGFVLQLFTINVFTEETKNTILTYNIQQSQHITQSNKRTWNLLLPASTLSEYAAMVSDYCIFNTEDREIECMFIGQFSIDGVCNHPSAQEVL